MPDTNAYIEGLLYIDPPANMSSNMVTIDSFPDSQAAAYGGGYHMLYFSGKMANGYRVYSLQPMGPKGNFDSASPIYGLSGFILKPLSTDTPDGVGRTSPAQIPVPRASGWGRLDWYNYANWLGQVEYSPGTPNLREYYQIPRQDPCFPRISDLNTGFTDWPITGTGFDTSNRSITSTISVGVLDLISEGPVEGFVTGDYIYTTSGKNIGDIGYTDVTFAPYITTTGGTTALTDIKFKGIPEARNIYWNDTPLSTNKGYLNFSYTDFRYTYGEPNLHTVANPKIFLYEDRYHWDGQQVDQYKYPVPTSMSKDMSEQLIGGNFFAGEASGYVSPKRLYIYDTECAAIKVGLKINALYQQQLTGANIGETWRKRMSIRYKLWRLFSDKTETIATTEYITPDNPGLYAYDIAYYEGKIVTSPMIVHYTFWLRPYNDDGAYIKIFPKQIGWIVEVEKGDEEDPYQFERNSTEISFVSQIYGDRFVYPNAAMVYSQYDARYFNSVPARSYLMKLLKVKVPSNYDPIKKTYNGFWDGTFKLAWTDNPAWCYYDLLTNNRFGLGKYINTNLVDKWTLYEISQYCDTLVPDGYGGLEARYTCNLYITTKAEAYKVINDMASIFNGLPYYFAGQIFTTQDKPKDPIYLFNNSNVINGEFSYSDSSRKARRSIAVVRFNDEFNNYNPALEYVEDSNALARYGIRETEIAAFGATRRSQARRLGKWILASENLETEIVNFDAGVEANLLRPGDLISIQDQNRRSKIYAGRTLDLNSGSAILDIPMNNFNRYILTGVNSSFDITFLTPSNNLNQGTYYGDDYLTGQYGITSFGETGINSSNTRKSQIQQLTINNSKLSIVSGDNQLSGFIKVNFSDATNVTLSFKPVITGEKIIQSGLAFIKIGADGWGDAQIYSDRGYNINVYAQASPLLTDKYVMFGLNSDPLKDQNYTSLDYAFYYSADKSIRIYESNNQVVNGLTSGFSYTTDTALTIEYDGEYVNYYSGTRSEPKKNFWRKTSRAFDKNSKLYFDSSFHSINAQLDNIKFGAKGLYSGLEYALPKNTVWAIDVSTGNYGGINSGINVRYEDGNTLYPGWYLESYLDKVKNYRITNIVEKENFNYQITALEYNPLKYSDIDSGLALTVPIKRERPLLPSGGVSIIYRSPSGSYAPVGTTTRYTTNQLGVNSILINVTGNSDNELNNLYYLYVKSGSNFETNPGQELLVNIYNSKPFNNLYLRNNNSLIGSSEGTHAMFTPAYTGDYYIRFYAENESREQSPPMTGHISFKQQTTPIVVISSGISII